MADVARKEVRLHASLCSASPLERRDARVSLSRLRVCVSE